jgi:serine/threonine protein kinase
MSSGTRLGPYEIVAPIGAGGMGEVYKARDTRLDRSVAVKILPEDFARNAQLKIRFEREAKTISRLSHPHICALFDVGENYLVMELLDGETLADRLARGPLPAAEAVQIGIHIADALDQAHRAGIIHRDLKPGNVMLTSAGVKLLDFGLAKPTAPLEAVSATLQKPVTEEGTIVGTLQYMAPEQLEGREVDGRADIFALGAILYEMLSGRRAFGGSSRASIIANILAAEPPPLTSLSPLTPAALDRIVKRCLAKNPTLRWQCAGDLRHELELLGELKDVDRPPASRSRSLIFAASVLALIAAAEGVWLILQRNRPSGAERMVRFTVEPPPNSLIELSNEIGPPALSRDGKSVAFVAVDFLTSRRALWVRDLASVQAKRIDGTEGAGFPFWSPDGKSIGFFASGKLKRVDLAGGAPETLCPAPFGRGASWGADGKILFVPTPLDPICRVSARGGAVEPITQLDKRAGDSSHRWPYILPDGRHFLLFIRRVTTPTANRPTDLLYVADLVTGEKKFLTPVSSNAIYVDGSLLYVRHRTLFAQPFDLKTLQISGEAVPVAQNVQFHPSGFAMFTASSSGVLCYQIGSLISEVRFVDRHGNVVGVFGEPAEYSSPALDVAHRQLVVSVADPTTGSQDVWHYDMDRGVPRRLTFHPADEISPIFSPDGRRVAFASNRSGQPQIFVKSVDGADVEGQVSPSTPWAKFPLSWSPDGRFIAYKAIGTATQMDVNILDLKEGRERQFLASEFNESDASFSPSGRWIAYTSDESGRPEVYVTSFPTASARWQISAGGGSQPRWRGNEKELYYLSADGSMVAVPVEMRPDFKAGVPQRLFPCELRQSGNLFGEYDVSPDGQRFLINTTAGGPRSLPLTIVIGWQFQ